MTSTKQITIAAVIILILGAAVYFPSFEAPFYLDGYNRIVHNVTIRSLTNIKEIWAYNPTRFIPLYSFAVNYNFHYYEVFGYHVFNFLIHLTTTFIFFLLASRIFHYPKIASLFKKPNYAVLFSTLVFLLHPIQTSAVTYVVQRITLFAALFYLATILFYVLAQEREDKRWYYLSIVCAILGALSKPIVVTLPITIYLYEACFRQSSFKITKKLIKKILPYLCVSLAIPFLLIFWRFKGFAMEEVLSFSSQTEAISRGDYLLTQFNILIYYIRLLFSPLHQNFDYDFPVIQTLFQFPTWISLLTLICLSIFAVRARVRQPLFSFGILWFLITLAPESSLIPIADIIFEHRLYLPMVGFALMLPLMIQLILKNSRLCIILMSVVIISYSTLSFKRNQIWSDKVAFVEDNARKSPYKSRVFNNLGFNYHQRGLMNEAMEAFTRAIILKPTNHMGYHNRGALKFAMGDFKGSVKDLDMAIELEERYVKSIFVRADAYQALNKFDLALEDYQTVRQKMPGTNIYNNRALLFMKQNDLSAALDDLNLAIELEPKYATFYNRAKVYRRMGHNNKALKDLNLSLRAKPQFAKALNLRGLIYFEQGSLEDALLDFSKVLQLHENATAYFNRSSVYYQKRAFNLAFSDALKAKAMGYKVERNHLNNLRRLAQSE